MENKVGDYIRFLRKQKKVTLVELAEKTGLSQPYLSQIETNKRETLAPDLLEKLAKALDADYVDLMRRAGHSFIDDVLNTKAQKGNLVFDVNFTEEKKDANGVTSSKVLSKEEVLQRFFDIDKLMDRQEINYKGISLDENDKQLLTTFLDALTRNRKTP